MVSRGHCILLEELRSKQACSSVEDTVSILYPAWSSKYELKAFKRVVKAMFDAGSRYKNIEGRLGKGSWLVLGKFNPETTWTKLICKSGKVYSDVMDHMESLGLSTLASGYKDLSAKVMGYELNRYVRNAEAFRALPPAASTPIPRPMTMPMPTANSMALSDTYLMDVESPDEGDSLASGTGEYADLDWDLADGFLIPR